MTTSLRLRAALVGLGAGTLALGAAVVFLRLAVSSWRRVGAVAVVDPADLLLVLLCLAGAALAAWLGIGATATALARGPGALGAVAERVAEHMAPAVVRRMIALLAGTAVAAALAPGTAVAAPDRPGPVSACAFDGNCPGGPGLPDPGFHPLSGPGPSVSPSSPPPSVATPSPPPVAPSGRPVALPSSADTPVPAPSGPPAARPSPAGAPPVAVPSGPAIASSADLDREPGYRPAAPRVTRTPVPIDRLAAPARPGAMPEEHYVVRRGDTLWDIAARHLGPAATAAQIAGEWPRWYAANRQVIGADPDRIRPGQRLAPPSLVGVP